MCLNIKKKQNGLVTHQLKAKKKENVKERRLTRKGAKNICDERVHIQTRWPCAQELITLPGVCRHFDTQVCQLNPCGTETLDSKISRM
ncbi:hypothetical protein Y032_0514g2774 [Ancylostoma ceylanicum]|uniref:Uncharacterized protein n=1 Tax=Ancylostoma ceylanicum TaxID=53326 RepID=A0A016WUE8_9BILA|nr:hypothetical protein Y032_0514g2774 [Ancylostoma ceylanicum]